MSTLASLLWLALERLAVAVHDLFERDLEGQVFASELVVRVEQHRIVGDLGDADGKLKGRVRALTRLQEVEMVNAAM